MSIEAKVTLTNRLEQRLAETLPLNTLNDVLAALADELQAFSVEHTEARDIDHDDCMDAFLAAKLVEGRSQKTLDRYKREIRLMMRGVGVPTRQISVYHLRGYITAQKERGLSDTTLEGMRQIICLYFNWLQRESLIDANPAANIGAIKCAKKIKYAYTDVEVEKLKEECGSLRNKAIVMFLGATGCRIGEVITLNRSDINFTKLECKVLGKGNKERVVFLDPVSAMAVQEYLRSRTDRDDALFVNTRGKRITSSGIRSMLVKLGQKAGVAHVHPHRFRRTLATNLASSGMPIQEVASILGHEDLDTTMKYVCMDRDDIHYSYRRYA